MMSQIESKIEIVAWVPLWDELGHESTKLLGRVGRLDATITPHGEQISLV